VELKGVYLPSEGEVLEAPTPIHSRLPASTPSQRKIKTPM